MRVKLWLLILIFLLPVAWAELARCVAASAPVVAQGPILFFPIIFKSDAMKSTIAIVSPYGNTNYVLNPSGETTSNFSLQGSSTVTRVTTYQKYGLYSYQMAVTASGGGINLTLSSLTNAPHYVSFRIRKPESVRLNVTIGSATKEARLLERIDATWSLYWAAFSAAEASGQTNLRITQIGAGTNTMYLDGAQAEPNKLTAYIDGTQEGARWNGAVHGSTSTRSADSRAGGDVKDFWQEYGFFPEKVLGAGAAVEDLNIDSYAFLPGGELNSSKIRPREFTIIGFFLGDSKEALHAKAQALELELGLDTYPGRQPVRIRYYGARVQKEIAARYTGGLEGDLPIFYNDDFSAEDEQWMRHYKFKMKAAIQFIATDPFWYEVGESAALLDTNDTATLRYIAGRLTSTGQWSSLGLTVDPILGGDVNAIVISPFDGKVYIGGSFVDLNGVAGRDYVAAYDLTTGTWETVGNASDFNDEVLALAFGPDGTLYAGGFFSNVAGNASADLIARKPAGSGWTNLGAPGVIGAVNCITISPIGDIYIGGDFTNFAGIAAADYIVYWDTSAGAYAAVVAGASAQVRSIVFTQDGSTAYFGGAFANWGDANGDGIVGWDGTALSSLSTGASGGTVFSLALSPDGTLYVGGAQTTLGGVTVNEIGSWNGQAFQALGDGVDTPSVVAGLTIGHDGVLYLVGDFASAGGLDLAQSAARWNGYTYSHLDIDLPGAAGSATVFTIAIGPSDPVIKSKYDLFVGFDTSGSGAFAGLETAQNEGSISAFPKIIYNRSGGTGATIQTLRNERTGRELLFNYALLDGETLTIDLNPKNRTIISSFFGPRMDAILANSDFSTWQLLPGANDITSFVSEDGSPTVTAFILFREPYRSWN